MPGSPLYAASATGRPLPVTCGLAAGLPPAPAGSALAPAGAAVVRPAGPPGLRPVAGQYCRVGTAARVTPRAAERPGCIACATAAPLAYAGPPGSPGLAAYRPPRPWPVAGRSGPR